MWTSACASCAHAVHPARRATVVGIDSGQRIRQPVYSHSQLPTQCTLELEPSHSQLPTQCTLELERSHSQLPTQCTLELERLRDKHVDTFCHLRGGTHIGVERKSKLGFGEVAASHDGIGACGARRCGCELPRQWLLRGSQLVEDRWRDRHFQRGLGIGWVGARGQRAGREAQADREAWNRGVGLGSPFSHCGRLPRAPRSRRSHAQRSYRPASSAMAARMRACRWYSRAQTFCSKRTCG